MSQEQLRQPIVVVLGHVDSGKTSLLDKIRGTAVQAREFGGITQHIGASFFPIETLKHLCGPLFDKLGGEIKIPGLLVIDTPGHEVFTNLRSRGGSAADIAILVVDVMKGFEQQTYESVEILKKRKVPFVVALNKLDTVPGWRSTAGKPFLEAQKQMSKAAVDNLDIKIYEVVGALSRLGITSEAFYRVTDFTKEIAIVPISARNAQGIPELVYVLVGLTQQYLTKRLVAKRGSAKGIVLEVKEEPGLGQTANVILIDGILRTQDKIVVAKMQGAVATRVKALFMPKPLDEMRDPRDRFTPVNEVVAAAGVKVSTPDLEDTLPGSPLIGIGDVEPEKIIEQVNAEVKGVMVSTDQLGVIIKSDAIGSLEAIVDILKTKGIPIRSADIGPVSRRDVVEASLVGADDRYLGVILAFGVKVSDDGSEEANSKGVRIFSDRVIYSLVDSYMSWVTSEKEAEAKAELSQITYPCKFKVLKGMVFRRNNPAIFGVEVLAGKLKKKAMVINSEGEKIGIVQQIQDQKASVEEAPTGSQVAISMDEPTIGRTLTEGETVYTLPSDRHVRLLQEKYRDKMSQEEQQVFEEILSLRRKVVPLYGF